MVLNGARSDCAWHKDAASPVPGLIPMARMPVAFRNDGVHNSNDSFFWRAAAADPTPKRQR
ncbi:MAG: hypothetical protein ACO1PM_27405 [Acidovorax sp.]